MDSHAVTPVRILDDSEFLAYAATIDYPLPIEQAPIWDSYDRAVDGRTPWRRLGVWDTAVGNDAPPVAILALTEFAGRGFTYLWSKHGPLYLSTPTPASERLVRKELCGFIRREAPHIDFVRLHAVHAASDLKELLQTVTYDHTVVVDLTQSEEDLLASFSKRGRYRVRKVLKDTDMVVTEETGISPEEFSELYDIYLETARRDGFGIFEADVYLTMMQALGSAARLFVARRHDAGPDGDLQPGRAVSWVICTVWDNAGVDYYAAGNAEARETNAALLIKWHIFTTLKEEGVVLYDLMGVGSARAPQLMGVREFKQQFGPVVEVAGAWDVPVRPWRYMLLKALLRAKRLLVR